MLISLILTPIFCLSLLAGSTAFADSRLEVDRLPVSNFAARIVRAADGRNHVKLTEAGKSPVDLGPVYSLPAGTRFYHWGSAEETGRLLSSAQFNVKNMNYRMMHPDHGGGGVYLSLDRLDSAGYGPRCVFYSLPHDIQVLHMEESPSLIEALGFAFTDTAGETARLEIALRNAGIAGIKEDVNDNWYAIFAPDVLVNPQRLDMEAALEGVSSATIALGLLIKFDQDDESMADLPADRWPELYNLFVKHRLSADDRRLLLSDMQVAYWDDEQLRPTFPIRTLRKLAKLIPTRR